MREFEELLEEVLRDEGRVEPLSGMEARVMARVASTRKPLSRKRMVWGPVAAGIVLLAVIGGLREREIVRSPRRSSGLAREAPVGVEMASGRDGRAGLRSAPAPRKARGMRLKQVKRSLVLERKGELRIEPIAIAPLAMEPLELASLSLEDKGKGRP